MPLATGQSLSFYEILGPLGAGAMGEIYRATDTRLEHEAKSLAALNHPNEAQSFGADQSAGIWFLVLELVPGEALEDRITRGGHKRSMHRAATGKEASTAEAYHGLMEITKCVA